MNIFHSEFVKFRKIFCNVLLILCSILLQCSMAHDEETPFKEFEKQYGKDPTGERFRKLSQVKEDIYNGCGFIKNCLKICAPEQDGCPTCIKRHDCRAVVTIDYKDGKYDVKMLRRLTENLEYIAIGVSEDDIMGADAIFACVTDRSETNHFAAYTVLGFKSLEYADENGGSDNGVPQDTFSVPRHTIVEDFYLCEFQLKPRFTVKKINFDLDKMQYYLFGANGEASSFWKLSGHARNQNGRVSSVSPFLFKDVIVEADYDEGFDRATDAKQFSSYALVGILSLILRAILN